MLPALSLTRRELRRAIHRLTGVLNAASASARAGDAAATSASPAAKTTIRRTHRRYDRISNGPTLGRGDGPPRARPHRYDASSYETECVARPAGRGRRSFRPGLRSTRITRRN